MNSATDSLCDNIDFPDRLSLAVTPTPLQPLDRLSEQLAGPRIWVKRDDLTGSHLSGNKVRKLEFVIAQALAEGCDTLITCGGLQSNHCRATALLGAQLGLQVHLILRGESKGDIDGNRLLDQLAGAQISEYPPRQYMRELAELFERWAEHYRAQGRKPFIIPTGASDDIGVWGYVNCCRELAADFRTHQIKPSSIVVATGSGGTQAGLTAGNQLFALGAEVLGMAVCDDNAYFQHKVREDLRAWQLRYQLPLDVEALAIAVNDDYIGPGYAQAGPEVFATIKLLASTEGLVLDPVYTGKAFHGLLEEIKRGRWGQQDDIVFVHTGGIFGLFPQRAQLAQG